VSASKGVEALTIARHNTVLENISKDGLRYAKKVGIIRRNKALARTDLDSIY
jgi:hypothetical protein